LVRGAYSFRSSRTFTTADRPVFATVSRAFFNARAIADANAF
jgi:hypothetical protein